MNKRIALGPQGFVFGCWLVLASGAPGVAAQDAARSAVVVSLVDGSQLRGDLTGIAGGGREANLALRVGEVVQTVPLVRVLAVHGAIPAPSADVVAYLVGGDQVRGDLTGGDEAGESLTVRSSSLGEVSIAVDRVAAVVFGLRAAGSGADAFKLPVGAGPDEALFRPAARGFDTILGGIHRFNAAGVLFEWAEAEAPELFAYDSLAAVSLRDGVGREGAVDAHVVTRAGDVLSVTLRGFAAGKLLFEMEGERRLELAVADVAALTVLRDDRRFLSDLEPEATAERATHFEDGGPPLFSLQRDRSVSGGFLVAGGVPYGKGLGVHSRCELSYRVPAGFTGFVGHVGIDDEVLSTAVRGAAEVSVLLDGEVCSGPHQVRGGQTPVALGRLEVRAGALLTLQVEFGAGWFIGDRVDWLHAVLVR